MISARRVCAVLIIAVVETTHAAHAQPFPALEVKGIKLGMTRSEIVTAYPEWLCRDRACGGKGTPTSGFSTVAGVRVEFVSVFFDDADKLVRLMITVPTSGAFTIAAAFKDKYGMPVVTEAAYQTRGGVKATQFVHTWQQTGSTLRLTSPASRIDQANLTLFDEAYLLSQAKKLKAEAAKDL